MPHCDARSPLAVQVAIKRIAHLFQDLIDAKRVLREIKLLRHMSHDNVVKVRGAAARRNRAACAPPSRSARARASPLPASPGPRAQLLHIMTGPPDV